MVVSGFAVAPKVEVQNTYDPTNGTLQSVIDDKGNLTSFSYDAFDRRYKTCHPNPTTVLVSSTSDCAQQSFDAYGRVNSVTPRGVPQINVAYDTNDRLSSMTDAGSGTTLQSYTYNNFSNVLTHAANGGTETYTYDALDGVLSDQQPLGGSTVTVSYSYDIYGRRSRLTYPSYSSQAFYVAYGYNNDNTLANEKVAFNGGTENLQATFTEDSFARLASLKYGPSTPTVTMTPTYDTSSRLSSLKNDLAGGTTNDAIWNLGYSAAQQILTRNQTGSANYKYVAPANIGPNTYGVNGLDQITAINATSFTYDTKGNLTSDGVTTYSYNDYNMLTQAIKGATTTNFTYDPSNRLASVAQGSSTTRFIYDGNDVIAEYNGSNVLQRRYVHGPSQDNPLLWYEGTDDTNLRFFTTDQQGSVTATTSSAGTLRTIYTYDEYGKPLTASGTDVSRFRYTGQVYLSEVDLYNYKARLYDPKIGRFLQTDPIGYGDGLNWYAYAGNDPVNLDDPTGTDVTCAYYGQQAGSWSNSIPDPQTGVAQSIGGLIPERSASGCHDDSGGGYDFQFNRDWQNAQYFHLSQYQFNSPTCMTAVNNDKQTNIKGMLQADMNWDDFQAAALTTKHITAGMIAALGMHESNMRDVFQNGGNAAGIMQIDLGWHKDVSWSQALDVRWSAFWAAGYLEQSYNNAARTFSNPSVLMQATFAGYNLGSSTRFSGDPSKIDQGTTHNNYGKMVSGLVSCFP